MPLFRSIQNLWHSALARFYCLRGDAHRHFGNSYGDIQEYWAAVEDYTRAITLNPAYTQAYYNRGVLYWREIGNYYRAIQDLTRVVEADTGHAEVYFNRGLAYKLHRQPEQALADLYEYLARGQDEFWLEAARGQIEELREEQQTPRRPGGMAGMQAEP